MNYEEAKATIDKLRPHERKKFNNVKAAWLAAKMQSPEGEEPTRFSVRKVAGESMGTVCRYLPIVQSLKAGQDSLSDDAAGFDSVMVGVTLKINAAIAAFVITKSHKSVVADILRLHMTIVDEDHRDD